MMLTGLVRSTMASSVTCASRWRKSISHYAFARLSGLLTRLKRSRELLFDIGQGELKCSTARLVRSRPQLAPMSMDDGAANRQPHACSTGLRGVEGVEDPIEIRRIDAWPGIAHGHEGACLVLLGTDQQLSRPLLNRAYCFSRVENQVQQDLLQLNAIPQNRKQSLRKPSLNRNAILVDYALRQYEHFAQRRIEIKAFLSRRRLLHVIAHPSNDVPSPVRVPDNTTERFPGLTQIRRIHFQKAHSRTGVVASGRDRM